MKKLLQLFFIILITSMFSNIYAQSPVIQQILNASSQDSLIYFVRELSGNVQTIINGTPQTILSRNKFQPGNALAETYIKQKLEYYGLTTTIQSFSTTGKNVLAVQPGTEYPNQKYIICAHFDDMPSGTTAPGADDNASGTAAVLEAARIFTQHNFPFTIVYALWDEEEQGLVGSNYYATQAANAGDSILGVINLDMIAYDSNNDGIVNVHNRSVGSSVELYQKMVEVNTQYGINLSIVSYNPGSTYSDHASFWNKGYGAILLIEDDNDFNAYYHTTSDLIQYFNQPYFFKSAKLAFATLAHFALNLNMNILHTPIASTDISNPINTTAQIVTGMAIGSGASAPRLYYRTGTGGGVFGQFNEVVGTTTASATYNFTIPTIPLGTIVQYYIAAQDVNSSLVVTLPKGGGGFNPPGSTPPQTFFQFYVAPITVAIYDEANNTNGWSSSGGWNITTSKFVSPPTSFTDSPSGNYSNNVTATFRYLNTVSLSSLLGAELEYSTQWDIENNWDYGQVQISTNGGSTWIAMEGLYTNPGTGSFQPNGEPLYDGTQTNWVNEKIDLSNYVDQTIGLRFLLRSDGSVTGDGWYLDNIKMSLYNSVIPVELSSFTAVVTNNKVTLNWITATELNNLGFEIHKSTDFENWQTTGFVKGNGTSTEFHNYSFVDDNPAQGKSYYRLKQIDLDGTYKIYDAIEVDVNSVEDFALNQNYPNPFNPSTVIKYSIAEKGFVELRVYDIIGNEVTTLVNSEQEIGNYEVSFNASKLSSGVYIYTLKSGSFVSSRKMLLVK